MIREHSAKSERFRYGATLAVTCLLMATAQAADDLMQPIHVSPDHHFLAQPDGQPFFWLGDTAWALFQRSTREEADRYLEDRAAKGFTVIQAVALGFVGIDTPNRYGERTLLNNDPTTPNPRYFDHVDWIVARAAKYGLRIALLPNWGVPYLRVDAEHPSIMTPANARMYGRWLGARYRDKGVIWVLGGDSTPLWRQDWSDDPAKKPEIASFYAAYDAMAEGLKEGMGVKPFITYHPPCCSEWGTAPPRTSLYFGDREWLSMNMLQSSHFLDPKAFVKSNRFSFGWKAEFNYQPIFDEYRSEPTRPVIDGESRYENLRKDDFDLKKGSWASYDSRNSAYHSIFAGAAGHTYGDNSIYQFFNPELYKPDSHAVRSWMSELDAPGAQQMRYVKALMLSRPYFTRIPDQSVIVGDADEGVAHIGATRDREGSYMMVYLPQGQSVTVDLIKLSGLSATGWWFDPRTGQATHIEGSFPTSGTVTFTPPSSGPESDWVLVLDTASNSFGAPGAEPGKR